MSSRSREAIIAKYTNKSHYKHEYIYGDVYVDEERITKLRSNQAKDVFNRELKAAIRFSIYFCCDVFLLPEGDKEGNAIYVEKHKNPDAIIHGHFIDFKQAKGTDTSITKKLVRGLGQAEGIVISIEDELEINKAVQWLNGKINSLKKLYEGFIVIVEDNKGNYGVYTINGKRLSSEESLLAAAQRLSPSDLKSGNS